MPTTSDSRVTLSDIAKRLKVTASTVSRAINNPERISSGTREKVMRLVQEMNYKPNSAARILKTRKTGVLGYLYNRKVSFCAQYTPVRIFEALEIEAQGCGYHMSLASIDNGNGIHIPPMVDEERIDGIFVGGDMEPEFLKKLKDRGVPMVLLGNYSREVDIDCVIQDDIGGAYQLTKHLLGLGHNDIGFIGAPFDNIWSWERLQGMRLAMDENKIAINEDWINTEDLWSGREGFLKLMSLPNKPTAIICACDRLARTVLDVAREKEINIPDDISVVGFDNEAWTAQCCPPLTTVDILPEEIGKAAIQKMTSILNGAKSAPSRTVIQTRLIIRGSTSVHVAHEV